MKNMFRNHIKKVKYSHEFHIFLGFVSFRICEELSNSENQNSAAEDNFNGYCDLTSCISSLKFSVIESLKGSLWCLMSDILKKEAQEEGQSDEDTASEAYLKRWTPYQRRDTAE